MTVGETMTLLTVDRFGRRTLLAACAAVPLIAAGCSRGEAELIGTKLTSSPAPDFELADHRGDVIKLSALQGKAVVLTFIYTHCPDVCPLTAVNVRATYDELPEETRSEIAWLAVTVDPERDSAETLREFSERFGLEMVPEWHAFPGARAELEPIWIAYGIDPGGIAEEIEAHLSGSGRPYELSHTDALYVIDTKGNKRVLLRADFDPADLAKNLRTLT